MLWAHCRRPLFSPRGSVVSETPRVCCVPTTQSLPVGCPTDHRGRPISFTWPQSDSWACTQAVILRLNKAFSEVIICFYFEPFLNVVLSLYGNSHTFVRVHLSFFWLGILTGNQIVEIVAWDFLLKRSWFCSFKWAVLPSPLGLRTSMHFTSSPPQWELPSFLRPFLPSSLPSFFP